MSGKGFSLDDYVDVAERIRQFNEKFPDGSLQGRGEFVTEPVVGYLYVAKAYRAPDDQRPGMGTAFEPIPGKTPYTRDSEVQNAETAAWGRAIVALGFETKKIASRQEVKAREPAPKKSEPKTKDESALLTQAVATVEEAITELAAVRGVDRQVVVTHLESTVGANWRDEYESTLLAKSKLKAWWQNAAEKKQVQGVPA